MTDAGMCGDYDSVIGMSKSLAVHAFAAIRRSRAEHAGGPATLCAVFLETDDATGLARAITPIREEGCRLLPRPSRSRMRERAGRRLSWNSPASFSF